MVDIYGEINSVFNGKTERIKGRVSDIVTSPEGKVYILTSKSTRGRRRGLGQVRVLENGKFKMTSLKSKFVDSFTVGPDGLVLTLLRGGRIEAFQL